MAAIVLENVTKAFDGKEVVKDFSLSVEDGEFLTVIGRSGCGKTTMLKMINGLHRPDRGRVLVNGCDVSSVDVIGLRRQIGYVIQSKGLFPHMSVAQNITYVPVISGEKNKQVLHDMAIRLLELVGLSQEYAQRYPSELSGGQQQRVGIARALAAEPKILLMDEPFGALDGITKRAMQKEIKALQQKLGVTIVFITHDIEEALKLGDRALVMDQGELVQLGSPKEIKTNPASEFVQELLGM